MMQSTLTRYAFFEGAPPPHPSADYTEVVRTVRDKHYEAPADIVITMLAGYCPFYIEVVA